MPFNQDASPLIQAGQFEKVEELYMAELEKDPLRVEEFLETAKSLRKVDERSRADALLGLLADALKEKGAWPERVKVLREIGRLSRNPANLRGPLEEAITNAYKDRPSFKKIMQQVKFNDPSGNPVEKAEKVDNWLMFEVGEPFFMAGRGAGVVTELNPDLAICRLDFEKEKRVSVPLGAALKFLTPLPKGHLLREKIDNPAGAQQSAQADPAGTFARILQSFRRAMTVSEVRDALIGIVPEAKWSSWWTSARKHPQIVVAGSGTKASYSWSVSSDIADQKVKKEFASASLRDKLELAKKHSGRSKDLADYFSSTIAAEAEKNAKVDPALTWETFAVLEKLPGAFQSTFDPTSLLTAPMAARTIGQIPDRLLREKALKSVAEVHPDWKKVYGESFFLEDDPRNLTLIFEKLEKSQSDIKDRLIDETLRNPRRHPKAFYWYTKKINESQTLPDKANYSLLFQILEALTSDEFGVLRPRLKELFDKGALGIRIVMQTDNEDQARKLAETLVRYGSLEEYRRENLANALHMKYPSLREPQVEPLYATAESLTAKRAEFENLKKVEIPANSKALQEAREMGDLRENFEYKAARARAEYLSARVGELSTELSRVRVLDPAQIDTSVVRIGTKVLLSNGDVRREVTILGPWESAPEHGVYSNQSDVAKALIGHSVSEVVSFMGNDYVIETIDKWM